MKLTPLELITVMRKGGWPGNGWEAIMTAVALRESAGDPMAFNGKPPDKSYGLLQINMIGKLSTPRLKLFGMKAEEELFDPIANARAGFLLSGGPGVTFAQRLANVQVAWAIYRKGWDSAPDGYQIAFVKHLAEANLAVLQVS